MRFAVLCVILLGLAASLGFAARVDEDLDLSALLAAGSGSSSESLDLGESADAADAAGESSAYDTHRFADLDLDLIDSRALASLDFRDPGPPPKGAAALLEDASSSSDAIEDYASSPAHASARHAAARLSADGQARLSASNAALLAGHAADMAADDNLDALLSSDADDASWAQHSSAASLIATGARTVPTTVSGAPAASAASAASAAAQTSDPSNPQPDVYQQSAAQSAAAVADIIAKRDQARIEEVARIAAEEPAPKGDSLQDQLGTTKSGKNMTLDIKMRDVRKQLDDDKSVPMYPAMDRILNRVDKLVKTYGQLDRDVQASRITPATINPDAMQTKADKKVDLYNQVAPTAKDIIDCTACRYTWMQIEVDLGNAVDPVALYDAFVHHCSEMQLTNIFKHPCNAMFASIDKMIGDYVASMSVNQLCMHAGLCRMFWWTIQLVFNILLTLSTCFANVVNLWPMYRTSQAIVSNDDAEKTRWFAYWVVMAPLMALELSPSVTGMIPGYASFKIMLIFWLVMPKFQGAELLYTNAIHPLLSQYEADIDSGLRSVRDNINQGAAKISQKGMDQIRQHSVSLLLKGQSLLIKTAAEAAAAPAPVPVAAAPAVVVA